MIRIAFMLAVAVLLAGCAGGTGARRTVAIEVSEFKFSPSRIELKAGERVQLKITNKGTLEHDLNIKEMPTSGVVDSHSAGEHAGEHDSKLHVFTPANKSGTLDFTPSVPGTFEVYCSVAGHKDAGMTAQIVVQ